MKTCKQYLAHVVSVCCSILLMTMPIDASAAEQQLSLDNNMIAIYNDGMSEQHSQAPKAAVLLIHGWASQMNEVGDMFANLATQLAVEGYASLRINIRGESERELSNFTLTSTFATRVEDAQTGLNYLRARHTNLPIGVVGFSLGGATAMALTGNNPQAIKSLVLWSSAGDPAAILREMSPQVVKQVLDTGEAKVPAWVELTVTRQHLLGMLGFDIFTPLKNYTGALMSIRGSDDFVPPQEDEIFANANAAPEEFYLISGADHIFRVLEPEKSYAQRVINHTLRWFNDTLK